MSKSFCFVPATKAFDSLEMSLIRSFEKVESPGLEQCLPCDENGRFELSASLNDTKSASS